MMYACLSRYTLFGQRNIITKKGTFFSGADMQNVWEKYQSKGVIIIGVPSNDFGSQEPGNNQEIKNFCEAKFGISFPMTEKVIVKGDNAHPFYMWAKENHGKSAIPKWNFHKIIINKRGNIVNTFTSLTNPMSKKFIAAIDKEVIN